MQNSVGHIQIGVLSLTVDGFECELNAEMYESGSYISVGWVLGYYSVY